MTQRYSHAACGTHVRWLSGFVANQGEDLRVCPWCGRPSLGATRGEGFVPPGWEAGVASNVSQKWFLWPGCAHTHRTYR